MAEDPNAQPNPDAAGTKPDQQTDGKTLLGGGDKPDGQKPGDKPDGDKPDGDKPGDKPDGDKPADKKGDKPEGAPEKYADFTAPEGVELDQEVVGKFTGLAKELNLSQGNAQKLVDLAAEHQQRLVQQQMDHWDKVSTEWQEKLKADKDFGGDKFNETVERAKRALDKFGANDEDLMLVIKPVTKGGMGLGNNPGVIRLLARVDKATSEDQTVDGDKAQNTDGKSAAEVLYPTQQGKK